MSIVSACTTEALDKCNRFQEQFQSIKDITALSIPRERQHCSRHKHLRPGVSCSILDTVATKWTSFAKHYGACYGLRYIQLMRPSLTQQFLLLRLSTTIVLCRLYSRLPMQALFDYLCAPTRLNFTSCINRYLVTRVYNFSAWISPWT